MGKKSYWLDLFTGATWQEFLKAGGDVSSFRKSRWKTVQKIKNGDYLLCYLTGISRFIGILEVISDPFQDTSPIWSDEDFPCRLKVKTIVELTPETSIPVHELKDNLSFFQNLKSPHTWTGHFRASPAKWSFPDGEAVFKALKDAKENPVSRPVDKRKLAYRPKAIKAKIGSVTVPESSVEIGDEDIPAKKTTEHTEIQWLLLKLGSDKTTGVARNEAGYIPLPWRTPLSDIWQDMQYDIAKQKHCGFYEFYKLMLPQYHHSVLAASCGELNPKRD
jgi:predicted RNA-binding protein